VTQEAQLRDPKQVIVYDELREIMPVEVATTVPVAYSDWKLNRATNGVLWMDEHPPIIDQTGLLVTRRRANTLPGLPEPAYEGGWMTLGYYASQGRGTGARLLLRTPVTNVIELREKREPSFSGAALTFGLILAGAGVGFAINAFVQHGLTTAERVGEVVGGTLLAAPGFAGIGLDLYGAFASGSNRVLYPPKN
jgi:hypothetical protein